MRPNFTTKQKLQYAFDNLMAAGAPAMVGMLGVLSAVIILLSALFLTIGGKILAPEGAESVGFVEAIWLSLMRTLDAGTMGGDSGWGFRILMLILPTLGGIFVISSLIGIIATAVEEKLADLRKGRSLVLESNHTVILGWSSQIFSIISEVIEANSSLPRHVIVLLADRDKVEMEDELRTRLPNRRNTTIICRSGSPSDTSAIEVVSLHTARSILILSGETEQPDFEVIKTILAITNNPDRKEHKYNIVTEMAEKANIDVVQMLGKNDNLSVLNSKDIIARVIAQTSRQSGLSLIYTDMLNFDGDEIYFKEVPQMVGKTYAETLHLYEDVCVMGLYDSQTGSAALNPPMSTLIAEQHRLVVLAEDETAGVACSAAELTFDQSVMRSIKEEGFSHPEKILFLGWNAHSHAVLREMDHYVRAGSSVSIIAASGSEPAPSELQDLTNLACHSQPGDTTDRALLNGLGVSQYHHVILQADDNLSIQESDARVLVTLLHLRDLQQTEDAKFNMVVEMLDVRNRDLAAITKVDDFIVSNHLISMMMAQLSENQNLLPVFQDLFDADGSEIYLKPAKYYIEPGVRVSFSTVIESASKLGETAIGYKIRAEKDDPARNFGVYTNPRKSAKISFTEQDKIIVLAD